jgi:asparagine synthase (glutamine-hydrolysing)
MCGIAGIAYADRRRAVSSGLLQSMTDVIAHRGPDAEGHFRQDSVGLGHRRLSIVDLAAGGQPMSNRSGSTWLVFNGEIYNHAELRPSLESAGCVYKTRSDSETIIHAYDTYGESMPSQLRGMFAFAIWDARRRELLLARDHTGIKPLYFALLADGTLVFGSEIKSLFASGLLSPEIEPAAIEEYLTTGHVSGERTLFKGVSKLLPGTTLRWSDGVVVRRRFWNTDALSAAATSESARATDAAAGFWDRFMESVTSQLMADVPLGVFLSGGLDSSLLVAAMREAGVSNIRSFSVGYQESEASELPWARLVSTALGTEHHEVLVDGADFFRDLPDLTWHRDLPLTFSASIPLYHVSRLAREHVKVVLTGEGSDELFAGYGRYPRALANLRWAKRLDRWLPTPARAGVAALARRGGPGYLGSRIARSFLAKAGSFEASCLEPFAEFSGAETSGILQANVPRGMPFGAIDSLVDPQLLEANPLEALLRYDQRTYMEELLMKQDTMSMAASIESRVPFLDHLLVEWSMSVPASEKLRGAVGKALVRNASVRRLPSEVVQGPKRGFLVPLARWLRGVGREALLANAPGSDDSVLAAAGYARLVDEHMRGADHTGRLWRLLALQTWRNDTLPRMAALSRQARESHITSSAA